MTDTPTTTTMTPPHVFHRSRPFLALLLSSFSALVACESPSPSASAARPTPNLASGDTSNGADNFYTSDRVDRSEGFLQEPVRDERRGEPVRSQGLESQCEESGDGRRASHGRGQRAERESVCHEDGRAGIRHHVLDLSFWGESDGQPRNAVAPDIYAEDFSAAVDFLRTQSFVDRERIGAHRDLRQRELRHQCGQDRSAHQSHRDSQHVRHGRRQPQRAQAFRDPRAEKERSSSRRRSSAMWSSRVVKPNTPAGRLKSWTDKSTAIDREFYDFYRTSRGHSPNTTTHPTLTSNVKFMNFYPFTDIETISPRPMLFIAGENAHSREFSEEAYRLAGRAQGTGDRSWRRSRGSLRPCQPHSLRQVDHVLPEQSEVTQASPRKNAQ